MVSTDPRLRLRLALSHREKARLSIQECAQALAGGAITQARHNSLFEFYTAHLRAAEQELTAFREARRRQLDTLQDKLSAALDSQFRISERVSTGLWPPSKANARNRQLTEEIAQFRSAIADCASLISVDSPDDAGGFVDLPLDHYACPDAGKPAPRSRFERALTLLLPVLMLFTVLLPWLRLGDYTSPLYGLAVLLSAAGISPDPVPTFLRFVWLPFVLIPLAAYPLSVLRDPQNAGWGLILTGAVMLSAVLVPLGALAVNPGGTVSFAEFITGLQFGAHAYLAGGLALVLLGVRRLRQDRAPVKSTTRGVLTLAGSGAAVLVIGFIILLFSPGQSKVSFQAGQPDPATGVIPITCRNIGPGPIELYVPWPEDGVGPVKHAHEVYGVSLYVRAAGDTAYRLLALSQGCWTRGGLPFPENNAFRVEPDQSLGIALDTPRLLDTGTQADQVRIVVSRANGREIFRFEADVPDIRRTPKAAARLP